METDNTVSLLRQIERLKASNSQLRSDNKKLAQRGAGYDAFLEGLEGINAKRSVNYRPNPALVAPPAPTNPAHEEIVVAALSDLHLSEVVKPEDSNGVGKYNSIIAANRLWQYSQKIKTICALHGQLYTLKKIWCPLLGDIINGTIHPECLLTNDLTDPVAVDLATTLLSMFYKEIGTIGLPIEVDAIHGNHPRTSLKMPTKRQAHTNLDWLIYKQTAKMVDQDQVDFRIHTGQIGRVKLFNWSYVFEHGMGVPSGGEEAFEDRIRALFDDPVYRETTGLRGPSFDQLVIGNMHKAKFLERTVVNGAFPGQNELGQSWRLKPIRASQLMWGVSKKQVRTWQYNIDLTDMRSEKVLNPFSEYTAWLMKACRK
jgi:hypothetical protein